jgi:L-alanine-DL-glutamate epimerase-like enolase superfamily enzyme
VIAVWPYRLALIDPFGIARGTQSTKQVFLANIGGGWGEASPTFYNGESDRSAMAALEAMDEVVAALPDLDCIEDAEDAVHRAIVERCGHLSSAPAGAPVLPSVRAAVNIALHDRFARRLGVPLHTLFGTAPKGRHVTSFTIGIDSMETMLRKVDDARSYDILKVKLGRDLAHDLVVMREIRRAVGGKVLRVDANGGWTLDEARRALPVLADLGVEFLEQPLKKGSIAELRELHKGSPLPIYVDEDSLVAADLPPLAGAADGINIKLMKSGGLSEARRMVAVARAHGFRIMVGCMLETSVGITAAAHLAPLVDDLDLDGNILSGNDPFDGVKCSPAGELTLPASPGLGVSVKPQYAAEFPLPEL